MPTLAMVGLNTYRLLGFILMSSYFRFFKT